MSAFGKTLLCALLLCAFTSAYGQEAGTACYYSDEFQGRKTASGEAYDKNELTGAHKTLEFGTYVKVTRLDNDKSVVVRINDRGPYLKGRVIDISRKAAEAIGLTIAGEAQVKLEVVPKPSAAEVASTPAAPPVGKKETIAAKTPEATPAVPPAPTAAKPADAKPKPAAEKAKPAEPKPAAKEATSSAKLVTSQDFTDYGLYKIQVLRPKKEGFGVQIASLANYENVLRQVADLQEDHFKNILVSVEKGEDGKPVYKIMLGPFPDVPTADSYKKSLKNKNKIQGFTVNLAELKF
jgi:rare lipoprotein A